LPKVPKRKKETGLLHPLGEVPVERPEPEPTPEEPVDPPDQHPDEPGETTPDENTIKPDDGTGSALGPVPVGKLLPASRTDHPARRAARPGTCVAGDTVPPSVQSR
jgi:hypothetical protein